MCGGTSGAPGTSASAPRIAAPTSSLARASAAPSATLRNRRTTARPDCSTRATCRALEARARGCSSRASTRGALSRRRVSARLSRVYGPRIVVGAPVQGADAHEHYGLLASARGDCVADVVCQLLRRQECECTERRPHAHALVDWQGRVGIIWIEGSARLPEDKFAVKGVQCVSTSDCTLGCGDRRAEDSLRFNQSRFRCSDRSNYRGGCVKHAPCPMVVKSLSACKAECARAKGCRSLVFNRYSHCYLKATDKDHVVEPSMQHGTIGCVHTMGIGR